MQTAPIWIKVLGLLFYKSCILSKGSSPQTPANVSLGSAERLELSLCRSELQVDGQQRCRTIRETWREPGVGAWPSTDAPKGTKVCRVAKEMPDTHLHAHSACTLTHSHTVHTRTHHTLRTHTPPEWSGSTGGPETPNKKVQAGGLGGSVVKRLPSTQVMIPGFWD